MYGVHRWLIRSDIGPILGIGALFSQAARNAREACEATLAEWRGTREIGAVSRAGPGRICTRCMTGRRDLAPPPQWGSRARCADAAQCEMHKYCALPLGRRAVVSRPLLATAWLEWCAALWKMSGGV